MDYLLVKDISKLQMHIYVLGYYPMGESILAIVWDKEEQLVYKSILIDCFENNGYNQMDLILKQYKINTNKLDYIIWTHPDYDHSVGFSNIISKYSSKKTLFLLPDGFSKFILRPSSLKIFKSIISVCKTYLSYKNNIEQVNTSNRRKSPIIYGSTEFIDGYHDNLEFDIEILTPFANQVFSKTQINKTSKPNDISISLMIRFGKQNFYFGGDTEDLAINMIEEERIHNIIFIKIPHHSSSTSQILPVRLCSIKGNGNMGEAISVSTTFVSNKTQLPDLDVLDKYRPFSSHILITDNREQRRNHYGMWKFVYNIRPQIIERPVPLGDTFEYHAV